MIEIECEPGSKPNRGLATPTQWNIVLTQNGEKVWGASVWNCDIWDAIQYAASRAELL